MPGNIAFKSAPSSTLPDKSGQDSGGESFRCAHMSLRKVLDTNELGGDPKRGSSADNRRCIHEFMGPEIGTSVPLTLETKREILRLSVQYVPC